MEERRIEDYVLARQPNKPMMKKAVTGMKGSDRSMAEFAAVTGLSTSMLSRIVNGNYSKPISVEILQKIADGKSKDCTLDLKDLLEANGMIVKEEASRQNDGIYLQQAQLEQLKRGKDMQEIITDELFTRGVTIKKLRTLEKTELSYSKALSDERVCDLAIAVFDEEFNLEWEFEVIPYFREMDDTDRDDVILIKKIIQKNAVVFLQDAWSPESYKHRKFSFCFADKDYFDKFIEALQFAKLNNRMSAILIDTNAGKVVDEYNFPCSNFPEIKSLFDLPLH